MSASQRVSRGSHWLAVFAALSIGLIALLGTLRPSQSADADLVKKAAYQTVEAFIRNLFNDMMRTLEAKLKEKKVEPTSSQASDAREGLKLMLYNKAYNHYVCTLAEFRKDEAQRSEASLSACAEHRNKQAIKFTRMLDYAPVIGASEFRRCGLQSRLFDAELEFKPYPFLEGEGMELYDYEKYNRCILNAGND